MSVTEFSVRHHVAVVVLCFGALVLGWHSYRSMPRESFPDVDVPFVIVTTVLDGANPTDVEQSVTIPLETELDGTEGLKEMRSVSLDSLSMISLEFDPDVNIQVALSRVRDAVDQAKPDLSNDAEEPTVKEFSFSSWPVLIYHLVGSDTVTLSELDDLAEKLEDEIKLIPGVLDVDTFGVREREVVIEIDPERLHFYHLPLAQVRAVLEGTNRNVSAGASDGRSNRIVMRVPGEFRNPAEIFALPIGSSAAGVPIYMRDVASVRYDFEDEKNRSRLYDLSTPEGGACGEYRAPQRSISLQIKKRGGASILEMCRQVKEVFARHSIPSTVRVVKGFDASKDVNMMVGDLENGVLTALVLVLAVIFVGMGFTNAVLVALAVPLSMLLSFLVLKAMGETLNMMVLFSLVLAVGMLVDNAIVIMECVYRHMCLGEPRIRAAIDGTREVLWPVITSTATTVAAFVPLLFWPGIVGEFMSYLPVTVIIVLTASLFVAVVITPTLGSLVLKVKERDRTSIDPDTLRPTYWLARKYQVVLEFMLDRPAWTLTTIVLLLVVNMVLYGAFGRGVEFFPTIEPDSLICSVRPPEGTSLARSDLLAAAVEARILGAPGSGFATPVQNVKFASVVVGIEGVGGPSGNGLHEDGSGPVRMQVDFVDRELRSEPTTATLQEMRNRLDGLDRDGRRVAPPLYGAEFDVLRPQDGPPTGKPVSIDIFGEDLNQMTAVIGDMKRLMRTVAGTVKPTDDAVTAQPTLEWQVERARAGVFGLEQASVSAALEIAVGGMITGTFGHGDDEQDIRLRAPECFRQDTDRLKNITIPVVTGGAVPVASVAAAHLVPGPVTIKHYNKRRVLNAAAEVQPGIRSDASIRQAFQEQARKYPFPPGIDYRFGGAAEDEQESREFLGNAFAVALVLIVLIMVLQFNSVAVSGIVMSSVILSLIGVFFGLMVTRMPFGIIMSGIGVISLAGVAVNNAILLLDATAQFEARGVPVREAVISASMTRLRPVLLTAVTTILGLVPMSLKLNWDFRAWEWSYDTNSAQWWQSMANAVVFGMGIATVLTLGIVPTLYLEYAWARDRCRALVGRDYQREG